MNETQSAPTDSREDGKARIIIAGAALGALVGLVSSYLYARGAEAGDAEQEARPAVGAGQLLSVLLTLIGLVRQIAELGRPDKDEKKGRK